MIRLSTLAVLIALTACSKTTPVAKPKAAMTTKQAAVTRPSIVAASPNISVSTEIADDCVVPAADPGAAPKFDYDDSDLLGADREVLDKIASCVVDGALSGQTVYLIGRADPRGTQEYNLGLGSKRAGTVARYLERVGVATTQLSISTRGDLDATGTDEPGWRGDRRVDMVLVPNPSSEN